MSSLLPKGSRDFGPFEVQKREYIFDALKSVFILYGYEPLQTPSMEKLEILTGKYGDEGDNLLFKVLNSGDFARKIPSKTPTSKEIIPLISEKGLRYDLTVPFARYVATHRHELVMPFKRYQIQPVWRADRPQKGRYREFVQCDLDVVGSQSIINEAELLSICHLAFKKLGFSDLVIKVNHSNVLQGIAISYGIQDNFTDFCVALDKLEKIGIDKVVEEWTRKGIPIKKVDVLKSLFNNKTIDLGYLEKLFIEKKCNIGLEGINDIKKLTKYSNSILPNQEGTSINKRIQFNSHLARGLSYYTGLIYEAILTNYNIGSVAAGGRYDDLTNDIGGDKITGVGISFGIERIYDVMNEKNMFSKLGNKKKSVLLYAMDKEAYNKGLLLANKIRSLNIIAEFYSLDSKLKKVFSFANKKQFSFVVVLGSYELERNVFAVKNMVDGMQTEMNESELLSYLV